MVCLRVFIVVLVAITFASLPISAQTDQTTQTDQTAPISELDQIKALSAKLCDILMKGDKAGFTAMVADDHQRDIVWWWESSGKGKYFSTLYGKCEFDKMVDGSKPTRKQAYIQRYEKDGVTKWGQYGMVSFEKMPTGEWKIIGYSL